MKKLMILLLALSFYSCEEGEGLETSGLGNLEDDLIVNVDDLEPHAIQQLTQLTDQELAEKIRRAVESGIGVDLTRVGSGTGTAVGGGSLVPDDSVGSAAGQGREFLRFVRLIRGAECIDRTLIILETAEYILIELIERYDQMIVELQHSGGSDEEIEKLVKAIKVAKFLLQLIDQKFRSC